MPTRRTFDLVIITALLLHPAVGLVKMAARRWDREQVGGGAAQIGRALEVAL